MLDHMSGLRRVTLNQNPLIADRGATFLAEVIEADLWIKGKLNKKNNEKEKRENSRGETTSRFSFVLFSK